MNFIKPAEVTELTVAQEHILTLQKRIMDAENLLDDLARAVEIAQYTKQYHVTEVFVEQSQELLKDRLVMPELDTTSEKMNIHVFEGEVDQETVNQVRDKIVAEGTIKVGNDADNVERAARKIIKSTVKKDA
jgi:hypothetical protein